MAINQSFENSGDVGDLQPGWSINIAATPHVIGELSSGGGSVNSQVAAREDSLFVINDNASTSYIPSSDLYYPTTLTGTVKSVSQTGNNVSISHSTQLDIYDVDKNIPSLTAGGFEPALDIAQHLTGQAGILPYGGTKLPGWGTSLCGHSAAFDADSNRVFGESRQTSYTYYNPSTAKYVTETVEYLKNNIWADNFTHGDPGYSYPFIYADGVTGDSFSPIYEEANTEHLAYRFILEEEYDSFGFPTGNILGHSFGFSGNPIDNDFDYGFDCSIVVSPMTGELIVGFDLSEGGYPVEYKQTYTDTFVANSEYTIYIKFSYGNDVLGSSRTRFYIQGRLYGNYGATDIYFNESISLYTKPTWYSAWGVNGLVRDVWRYSEFLPKDRPDIVGNKYNYIVNNDFETNTTGWAVSAGMGATSYAIDRVANTGNFPHGSWSARTKASAAASGDYYVIENNIKNFSRPAAGETAQNIFSFYAKDYSFTNVSYIVILFYDQLGNVIYSGSTYLTQDWERYSFTDFFVDDTVTELFLEINVYAQYGSAEYNEYYDSEGNPFFAYAGQFGIIFDAVQLENDALGLGLTDFWNGSMGGNGPTLSGYITENTQQYSRKQYLAMPALGIYENIPSSDYYTALAGYIYAPLEASVPAVKMNLWEYLQNASSAYGREIRVGEYGQITYPAVGDYSPVIENYSQIPSITPTSAFSGRSVDIVYTNAEVVSGAEVYDAYDDSNKILTVKSKETINVTINTNSSLNTVSQPKRKFSLPNADGYFIVSDSTGMPVGGTNTNTAWEDYGGKVSVAINPDIPGALDVTITGPFQEIPAYPGPYKLAYSDGSNDYAAFSVIGNGVKSDGKTLNLQTGAVRAKTKQEVAKTVNNPFIGTLAQAYDKGLWVSSDAAGPKVSLSATASNSNFPILPAGNIVSYGDSSYRILDCSMSNTSTSFNAQRYAISLASDFIWNSRTVAYHDGVWANNKVQDKVIAPYKYIDISTSSMKITNGYIGFDEYGQYFKFAQDGDGEAELLFDTDGTPYYEYLTTSNTATLLNLDVDFAPYYV